MSRAAYKRIQGNGMKEKKSVEIPALTQLESELERESRKMRYRGELGKMTGMRTVACGRDDISGAPGKWHQHAAHAANGRCDCVDAGSGFCKR